MSATSSDTATPPTLQLVDPTPATAPVPFTRDAAGVYTLTVVLPVAYTTTAPPTVRLR